MVGNTISHQKQNNNLPKEHKIGEGRKHNNENLKTLTYLMKA